MFTNLLRWIPINSNTVINTYKVTQTVSAMSGTNVCFYPSQELVPFWRNEKINRDHTLKASGFGWLRQDFLSRWFTLGSVLEELRGLQFLSLSPLDLLHIPEFNLD